VGPGGSQEAEYALKADVPAGTYTVVCDAVIIRAVDVTFDLVWRRGATDTTLATWTQHFEPLASGAFDAQAYEVEQDAPAIDWQDGDQLVFRYTGANTTSAQAFIPNGDGALAHGRIPNITLPP
jgi:FtsP/CotA-like multicopper oxidase with cupredoxin domain